jgi:hypothetical protein
MRSDHCLIYALLPPQRTSRHRPGYILFVVRRLLNASARRAVPR